MEFGPRALGARCILAAAQDRDIVAGINMLIKRREIFRPLAPAVLAEAAADYFGIHHAGALVYPFMLATAPVRPSKRNSIPAVVHIDGSARLQTVNRHTNPTFWRLIANYRALSGIPVVLNTSLNVADEPIVCSPTDAVRTFLQSGLDALVIGRYVVEPRREG
jgi:carbamoyltransferase